MYPKLKSYKKPSEKSALGSGRHEFVTRVIDGDTFMTSSRSRPIRLAGYSAPEKGERGYYKSKAALKEKILGREVRVQTKARDVYGRSVARVWLGSTTVNRFMKKRFKPKSR